MRHEWILNVLADLQLYAELNGLSDTAECAGAALVAAARELAPAPVPPPVPEPARYSAPECG